MSTQSKSAAPPIGAGYPPPLHPDLALAWLNYCDHQESQEAAEHLAFHLDRHFKERLPDRRCTGVLVGREEEIRQEAYLLLVGRYLAGNRELIEATEARDHAEIANQILKSLAGSITAISRTLTKHTIRYRQLHSGDPDHCPEATCVHPACRTGLWELPFELQREIVFAALRHAIQQKLLAARGANIAMTMVDEGLTQSDVAASLGISRQAVHQHLLPVRNYLRGRIDEQEFPLS